MQITPMNSNAVAALKVRATQPRDRGCECSVTIRMYSVGDYCDMYLIYGECRCNAGLAARTYRERYPTRRHPNANVFRRLDQRLRESGNMVPSTARGNRGRTTGVRTNVEADVLSEISAHPECSTRQLSNLFSVSQSTICRIIRDEGLYPYHYMRVQALQTSDYPRRIAYCQWLLQQHTTDDQFIGRILWTDEATFHREGILNHHNSHQWNHVNPHATRERSHQRRWSINVWAGILGTQLIGPYLLPARLNADNYLVFLRDVLPQLLEDVPLATRQHMFLQHDGAPAHFGSRVRQFLNASFHRRWIGRGGPVEWPARSPDLNPLDYFLWGHLKELVYRTPFTTSDECVANLHAALTTVNSALLQRVQRNILRRAQACCDADGTHFEHLL